jgi:hypothetical protein
MIAADLRRCTSLLLGLPEVQSEAGRFLILRCAEISREEQCSLLSTEREKDAELSPRDQDRNSKEKGKNKRRCFH